MRRLTILSLVLLVMALALPALASHVSDGGVDEAWTEEKNHEAYWEARFGMECTKFENHSGFIPEEYDAAVVKDGNMVRVYASIGGDFTALGAVNPANGQHFAAPHSWVMKCAGVPPAINVTAECLTLTIDAPEGFEYAVQIGDGFVEVEGTQSFQGKAGQAWAVYVGEQTIASGEFEDCSTTTTTPAETTTVPETTTTPEETSTVPDETTTQPDSTTTTENGTATSVSRRTTSTLPFTGAGSVGLGLGALGLLGLGLALVRGARDDT